MYDDEYLITWTALALALALALADLPPPPDSDSESESENLSLTFNQVINMLTYSVRHVGTVGTVGCQIIKCQKAPTP